MVDYPARPLANAADLPISSPQPYLSLLEELGELHILPRSNQNRAARATESAKR
jgi:hypothetical protein